MMDGHGNVIPSYLSVKDTSHGEDSGAYSNDVLRVGEVQTIIYPDSDESRSKRFIEYHVLVQHLNAGSGTGQTLMYSNCVQANMMAGLADWSEHTLRADDSKNIDKEGLGRGSKVLLLCLNGEHNQAIIIGGVRDEKDEHSLKPKAKSRGHHLFGVFNGISWFINKEGEFTLTYNGKTTITGDKDDSVDSKSVGTHFAMTSDGSCSLRTKDDEQYIAIDHVNKQILLKHKSGVKIGTGSDKMLLASTYRQKEQTLHGKIAAAFQSIQQAAIAAAAALSTAGASMATPISGAVAAGPQITTAATQLGVIAAQAGNAASAIDDFESETASYLSQNNTND